MKLNLELSHRGDNYKKKYIVVIEGGNIITDENNRLPNCDDEYINFDALFSNAYYAHSKGKVNTHFDYPYNGKYKSTSIEGSNRLFAYLNWWQRAKLYLITKQSWFHKYPVPTWGFLLNSLFALVNIYFAIVTHNNSLKRIESSYLDVITKQIELEKKQIDVFNKKLDIQNLIIENQRKIIKDTLK